MRSFPLCICFFYVANVPAQNYDRRDAEFGMELTSELQTTGKAISGDDCQSYNFVNLLRIKAELPLSKAVAIEASTISFAKTHDEKLIDDLQTFSNIDADNLPLAIAVCGINWTHSSPRLKSRGEATHSLFVGIRNMNEDYFTSPVTSFFTNSSCGVYPTISANHPIANYPVASVGVHYKYEKKLSPTLHHSDEAFDKEENDVLTIQASLYNGTGYNHFTGRNNVFRVCPKDDGVFGIAEVSYSHGNSFYSVGNAIHYNESVSTTPWVYAEQGITPNLTLIAGYSHSFATEAECKDFIGLGAYYRLGKYQIGAFTDYASFAERKEYATELTCKIPVCQHVDLQPAAHIITYDSSVHCAAMLRMALSF